MIVLKHTKTLEKIFSESLDGGRSEDLFPLIGESTAIVNSKMRSNTLFVPIRRGEKMIEDLTNQYSGWRITMVFVVECMFDSF